jgi:hypothetical protein
MKKSIHIRLFLSVYPAAISMTQKRLSGVLVERYFGAYARAANKAMNRMVFK